MISASNASDIVVKKEVLRLPFSIVFLYVLAYLHVFLGKEAASLGKAASSFIYRLPFF